HARLRLRAAPPAVNLPRADRRQLPRARTRRAPCRSHSAAAGPEGGAGARPRLCRAAVLHRRGPGACRRRQPARPSPAAARPRPCPAGARRLVPHWPDLLADAGVAPGRTGLARWDRQMSEAFLRAIFADNLALTWFLGIGTVLATDIRLRE